MGAITLAAARDTARDWLVEIKAGTDPRVAIAAARADTFAAVAEDFIKRRLPGQRQAKAVERAIRKDLIPVLGARPITEITRREIVELVVAIADRSAKGAYARNVLGYLKTIFNLAIERGNLWAWKSRPATGSSQRHYLAKSASAPGYLTTTKFGRSGVRQVASVTRGGRWSS